ncbi:MAG: hypothetical protein ABEJ44_06485 [Halanaeroarchaeum sp.]
MSFVADDRGRVPFALVAALLLVSTLTYTGGFVRSAPEEPAVPRLVEEATQEARLQLGATARAADRAAAREPVLTVAATPLGHALADDPFESALALRIAVGARERIAARRSFAETTVGVSVPPIADVADARRALGRVDLVHLDGDRYRVRLENVSVVVRRDWRVVERDAITLETTVSLPSMTVHERARTFERRLHAGITEPGLDRGLTARLFAVAWVRGYAQYGGAPIANVIANRHVGLLTNDALVDQQVAAFGRADPDSRRGVARAAADVAVADGVRGIEGIVTAEMQRGASSKKPVGGESIGAIETPSVMDQTEEFDVDRGADQAFVAFVDGPGLDRSLRSAYRARVRPTTDVEYRGRSVSRGEEPPTNGTSWFSYSTSDTDVSGEGRDPGTGGTITEYDRTVTATDTEYTYWTVNGTYAGRTITVTERTYDVDVTVRCRYERPAGAPPGRVAGQCPFGSVARRDLARNAERAIERWYDGVDSVVVDAVTGNRDFRWLSVGVDPPEAARERAYESTAALRETVRKIDVEVAARSMASTANPASRLAETVRESRDRLVDAPGTYDSAATVAEYVARERYLDELEAHLGAHSSAFAGMQDALGDAMAARAVPENPPDGSTEALPPIASNVSAEPMYLSLSARTGSPPLAARNVNVFTLPFGDVADAVSGAIGGDDGSTSLAAASQALAATNRALESTDDDRLRRDRDELRRAIRSSLAAIRADQRAALRTGTSVSRSEAARAVGAGYGAYDTVEARARAVVDGTIATEVARSLPPRLSANERDRAMVELRVATTAARTDEAVRVDEDPVAAATDQLRSHVRDGVEQSVRVGTHSLATTVRQNAMRSAAAKIPAGLPLTPIPGQWYATANVWLVSVEGGYERFVVESPRSTPIYGNGGTISYVRMAAPVRLDVDADGNRETIGRNEPIDLSVETGVFVVVPPGGAGVGDTDGQAIERSPGW